jgi:carbamoyl-phosphate synthase large subunit
MNAAWKGEAATVFITGAGGAAVPFLIGALRDQGYRVIAGDMDPAAAGLLTADRGYVIPAAKSDAFLPYMREVCHRESVRAVIPLVDEELLPAWELADDGIEVLLPRRDFVATCLDKHALMLKLRQAGIAAPESRLCSEDLSGMGYPLVIKPRTGRGSRGFAVLDSEKDLRTYLESSSLGPEQLMVQSFLGGTEFTISVVVWRDGEVQAVVPKEILVKKGITRMAVTRRHPGIEALCRSVQERLRADGPFNVQLRLDKPGGEPSVFEINPRFSTSISLTMAAGVDEMGELLRQALAGDGSKNGLQWREGVVLVRKTLDDFIDEARFNEMSRQIVRLAE